ncbi:ANT(3'')-Ia family aminoglycoside nucleotidyltransferase, partial [Pseudomonas aeruginosa]|nr:ANT(3'')-Ia family aminoglycoside nucleotidyltransferase [Pseudomonas aeruginosa]MCT4823823.1 ANT(3'')-Ia family aminoglycoside nucleotidyltransferase [Pseudomonas aeruginosa]MCT4830494.1 ANT(3'')-Ia family aminoglycoside nucleotidyltransferase [Pseudomonas aeruginosa]MCT4855775.1 ANT(3'')-Ia family aminoglycoside nucleotidyltransferase [Pseudomonas aeruginosa]MCT4881668.1 ANT(3'')-Ia family aminoglycoside nucleotidyltransferase [Pseudomonas aeruginosa]
AFVHFVKHEATKLLGAMPVMSNNSYMDSPHKW